MEQAIIVACSVFAAAFSVSVAAYSAAKGDSQVTTCALESIARQPEAKNSIIVTMLISVGLIESIPVIAAVLAIVLIFANPFLKV